MQYRDLPSGGASAPSSPLSGQNPSSILQQQTIGGPYAATMTGTGSDYRTLTSKPMCWAGTTGCTSQYGWYINLVSGSAYSVDPADPQNGNPAYAHAPVVYEQVIFNPVLELGAFIVNTTIPPANAPTMCFSSAQSGWTMAIDPTTGGSFVQSFFATPATHSFLNMTTTNAGGSSTSPVSGVAFGATGSMSILQGGTQWYGLTQTGTGPQLPPINPVGNYKGSRITWTQRR